MPDIKKKKTIDVPVQPVPELAPTPNNFWQRLLERLSLIGAGKEQEYFLENLATLLISGMGITAALEAILSELQSSAMRKIVRQLKEEMESGVSLWQALEQVQFLPQRSITLIRIGEESGRLSENLKVLVGQQQKERSFQSKIRSAMTYPLLVLFLTITIGLGIAWFILPRLSQVFISLRVELPLITRILIAVGKFVGAYGYIAVPLFFITMSTTVYFVFFYPRFRFIGQWILFHIPGVKMLIQESELSRFGYLFGTLLSAGMPVVEALLSISQSTIIKTYQDLYIHVANNIEEGNSFQKSFALYPKIHHLIPVPIQQLVIASEQSGRLSNALLKIGEIFEEKTDITTKNLAVILEPVLLVIVWGGVVSVALAVILPIYSLIGGLEQQTTQSTAPSVSAVTESAPIIPEPASQEQNLPTVITSTPKGITTLRIKETELGYLNVRNQPAASGVALTRVYPGETYEYLSENNGWDNIQLPDQKNGWVSAKYIEKVQ